MIPDRPDGRPARRCIVIGGGVAGLTAAYVLAQNAAYDVVVIEATERVGGKLRLAEVAGLNIDVGAESMLNRRPEGVSLAKELGLEIVHPTPAKPQLWSRGELRQLPRSVMGVPQDLSALEASGVLSDAGLARAAAEADLAPSELTGLDVSVGALVGARMGDEVVDRLVEPLLGGVYAGRAVEISARAAIPGLLEQATRGSWLAQAAQAPTPSPDPVFAGIPGGLGSLPFALEASGAFTVRRGGVVQSVERRSTGFAVLVNTGGRTDVELADDVIVATPAAPSARLLRGVSPAAAAELAEIELASVAIVTLAVPSPAVAHLVTSGFLVPPVEGRDIKAATFSWAKWDWIRTAGAEAGDGGVSLLRASLGRHRDEAALQRTDDELIKLVRADLAGLCGLDAEPVDVHVQRWGGGLPQYAVGHVDRVARVRAAVDRANADAVGTGRLAVCGAAYDGVGIPAVISSARAAAATIEAQLAS